MKLSKILNDKLSRLHFIKIKAELENSKLEVFNIKLEIWILTKIKRVIELFESKAKYRFQTGPAKVLTAEHADPSKQRVLILVDGKFKPKDKQ